MPSFRGFDSVSNVFDVTCRRCNVTVCRFRGGSDAATFNLILLTNEHAYLLVRPAQDRLTGVRIEWTVYHRRDDRSRIGCREHVRLVRDFFTSFQRFCRHFRTLYDQSGRPDHLRTLFEGVYTLPDDVIDVTAD